MSTEAPRANVAVDSMENWYRAAWTLGKARGLSFDQMAAEFIEAFGDGMQDGFVDWYMDTVADYESLTESDPEDPR